MGERIAGIPGLALVPGLPDGTGEDGTQFGLTGVNVLDTGDIGWGGHSVNRGSWRLGKHLRSLPWVFMVKGLCEALSFQVSTAQPGTSKALWK